MKTSVVAIDYGTSRTKVAYPDATGNPQLLQNQRGESYTPSVVYFPLSGEPIVGTEALNMAVAQPDRVVVCAKRHMGTDTVLYQSEDGIEFRAVDIAGLVLKAVKVDVRAKLGEEPDEYVVCVPANYSDRQKQETIDAARRAGMKVVYMPHEPTAAAFGNGLHHYTNCTALIYDLGGGTFDVSILRKRGNICEVLATNGEPQLGGQDFSDRIKEKALEKFRAQHGTVPDPSEDPLFYQDLNERVETLKVSLSTKDKANLVIRSDGMLLNEEITRKDFGEWTSDLLATSVTRMEKTIEDAGLSKAEIDMVFAVGGASQMPMVGEAIKAALGKEPSSMCEPHYAAVYGAVYAARTEFERQSKAFIVGDVALPSPDVYSREITSHSIGVAVVTDGGKIVCAEILSKGVQIPSVQVKTYKLAQPNQIGALIEVLQGEEGQPRDTVLKLGEFNLTNLPPRAEVTGRIEIEFNLDANGMLTAIARDRESAQSAELTIEYKSAKKNPGSPKKRPGGSHNHP